MGEQIKIEGRSNQAKSRMFKESMLQQTPIERLLPSVGQERTGLYRQPSSAKLAYNQSLPAQPSAADWTCA